jgi:signal transduction histidine kinase
MVRRRHPETSDAIRDVIEEVDRTDRLVHDLLDYARPMTVTFHAVDVEQLVERAVADAAAHPGAVPVQTSVAPGTTCYGDEDLLRNVLINLLTNAADAVETDGGRVEVRAEPDTGGGVSLEVTDNGTGIPQEDMDRLFTPFFSRKEAGVGLGLCLSRRIVEHHGGRLTVHSDVGHGTTVRVHIPSKGQET